MGHSPPGLWKHPKTGVFWIRRRVPRSIIFKVGRCIVQESLRTKCRRTAEALFQVRMGEIAALWAALEAQEPNPSQRAMAALAGEFCRTIIRQQEDEPGDPAAWRQLIHEMTRPRPELARRIRPCYGSDITVEMMEFLEARGATTGRRLSDFCRAFFDAKVLALRTLERMARGDYSPDPALLRFPPLEEVPVAAAPSSRRRLIWTEFWDQYADECSLSVGTRKRWRPLLALFAKHLRSEDFGRAMTSDVESWLDALLELGRPSAQTLADAHLPALRSFLAWCVEEKHLSENVASGVRVRIPKLVEVLPPERRSFTAEEAALILSESLRPGAAAMRPHTAAARRWVPWLCAYTGARVNEITQLRGQDVSWHSGGGADVPCILITPAAGTVKGGKARLVPLHSHLIEQGFLDFVGHQTGPLFYDPGRRGTAQNPAYRKVAESLAEWVRGIGVVRRVAPNHGWRHLFMTRARDVRMQEDMRERILGHVSGSVHRGYGEAELLLMKTEIDLMPRFETRPLDVLNAAIRRDPTRRLPAGYAKRRRTPASTGVSRPRRRAP